MKQDVEKRIFLNNKYNEFKNITLVQRAYLKNYKCKETLGSNTILNIVNNYNNTGLVDRKRVLNNKKTRENRRAC